MLNTPGPCRHTLIPSIRLQEQDGWHAARVVRRRAKIVTRLSYLFNAIYPASRPSLARCHSDTFHSYARNSMPLTSSPVKMEWTKAAPEIHPSPQMVSP